MWRLAACSLLLTAPISVEARTVSCIRPALSLTRDALAVRCGGKWYKASDRIISRQFTDRLISLVSLAMQNNSSLEIETEVVDSEERVVGVIVG